MSHHDGLIRPAPKKCTVALPVRKPNAAYRSREHLTEREVERLIVSAFGGKADIGIWLPSNYSIW